MREKLKNIPRLYVEGRLAVGEDAAISAEQSHYLRDVMRLKDGDTVRVFNAESGEWLAALSFGKGKKAAAILRERVREPEPSPPAGHPDLWLFCAPIRRAHFDFMVMKATELGAYGIQPIITDRSQVRDVNVERCLAIAIEAAEQSERLSIPLVREPLPLGRVIEGWQRQELPLLCAEAGEAASIAKTLAEIAKTDLAEFKSVAVITGPEGGFTAAELAALRGIPRAMAVRLGPRILRADTAALAAMACWQAWAGDWR